MALSTRSNGIEVGDIFRAFGPAYRATHQLPPHILKAMYAIEQCRTAALGGHLDQCDACGHVRISYNSCRNRHCPKCQSLAKEKWLMAREEALLPVPYFHVVFTIPDGLNPLALVNPQVMYNLLFKAASETLRTLGKDPKHLGAEIGFIAVLHTWGQNLMHHPHLHCIVPGGGLSEDGKKWVSSRTAKKKAFFIPVHVISELFKKKFLCYLKKAYQDGTLKFVGKIEGVGVGRVFKELVDDLYATKWVVYCKEPFGGPKQVLEYLGRYTHRVALSNNRIVRCGAGKVTFRWRDYQDDGKMKEMTLDAFEFIRRFSLHILPCNFCKIRYYGLLSSRNKKIKLTRCKTLLGVSFNPEPPPFASKSWEELLFELTGIDPRICPLCGKGWMVTQEMLRPLNHGPPAKASSAA